VNYHACLAHFPKITYARYARLKAYFLNLENLWQAELDEIVKSGIEENIAYEFLIWKDENPPEKILENLAKEKIRTISLGEKDYPKLLSEISDPPHTIFIRGTLPADTKPTLAVVGTRRITNYGKIICEDLVKGLTKQNIAIISGLALGIDSVAHSATLDNGGQTVAVLGSGIDQTTIYPAAHHQLAEKIIGQGGAIISEYPPKFKPTPYSFPARNRIIAGLSLGTLIIEAPAKSGALITANYALDYNREVLCVPHALTSPTGAGPNKLIKLGAKLITNTEDILETLNLQFIKQITTPTTNQAANPIEEKIIKQLTDEPKNIDKIILDTGLDSATVNSALIIMEINGLIKNLGGMNYIKK